MIKYLPALIPVALLALAVLIAVIV